MKILKWRPPKLRSAPFNIRTASVHNHKERGRTVQKKIREQVTSTCAKQKKKLHVEMYFLTLNFFQRLLRTLRPHGDVDVQLHFYCVCVIYYSVWSQ